MSFNGKPNPRLGRGKSRDMKKDNTVGNEDGNDDSRNGGGRDQSTSKSPAKKILKKKERTTCNEQSGLGPGGSDDEDPDSGNGDENQGSKEPYESTETSNENDNKDSGGSEEPHQNPGNSNGKTGKGNRTKTRPNKGGANGNPDIGENDGENDNESKGDGDEKIISDDPVQAVEDINQLFKTYGIPRYRRLKNVNQSDIDYVNNEGDALGEPNAESIQEAVQRGLEKVDESIHTLVRKTKGVTGPRRNAFLVKDPKMIEEFSTAAELVNNNMKVTASLAKAGMKTGSGFVKALAIIGGIALVAVGGVLTIASQSGQPVKIAAIIAEQVIKAGQVVGKKIDQKLEKDALKTEDALQLMMLLSTNEEANEKDGKVNRDSLQTFRKFKMMAAFNIKDESE